MQYACMHLVQLVPFNAIENDTKSYLKTWVIAAETTNNKYVILND